MLSYLCESEGYSAVSPSARKRPGEASWQSRFGRQGEGLQRVPRRKVSPRKVIRRFREVVRKCSKDLLCLACSTIRLLHRGHSTSLRTLRNLQHFFQHTSFFKKSLDVRNVQPVRCCDQGLEHASSYSGALWKSVILISHAIEASASSFSLNHRRGMRLC